MAATSASATATEIFLTLYVMSVSFFLCYSRWLFNELDCADSEVVIGAAFGENSFPDHAHEASLDLALVAVPGEAGDDEAGPADDLVLEVRPAALHAAVDREQQ